MTKITAYDETTTGDPVHQPAHYKNSKGGELIDFIRELDSCRGNVLKYVWRAGRKGGNSELQDLEKAMRYLEMRIEDVRSGQVEALRLQAERNRQMGDEGLWGNA